MAEVEIVAPGQPYAVVSSAERPEVWIRAGNSRLGGLL